jgi:hypothetical protein
VNIEGTIEDDSGIENFAQGLAQVPQFAGRLELKMAELIESPNAGQPRLNVAGVGDPIAP